MIRSRGTQAVVPGLVIGGGWHGDIERWSNVAVPDLLCYSRRGFGPKTKETNPDKRYLLGSQEDRVQEGVFEAPGSLREVESEVHVYLLDAELAVTGGADND